jgi:unsaturated rhamnogalacturonyl hydrolase
MSSQELEELVGRVTGYIMEHPDDRDWWERGPALIGIQRFGNSKANRTIERWIDRAVARQSSAGYLANDERDHLASGHVRVFTPSPANASSFGVALLRVYERTGEQRLLDAALRHADALSKARRTQDGGIVARLEAPELWIDFAYLMAPFLALLGKLTGEAKFVDEAALQVEVMAKHLVDPYRNLARHVWCETPDHFPQSTFWARGNGWLVAGLVDLIQLHPGHEATKRLTELLRRVLSAIKALQDRSGYLRHVLDDPFAPFESSGTLQFAYAAAAASRLNIVDASFREAALRAFRIVAGSVDKDGGVPAVALPPGGPGVPFGKAPFGQGFFLLAAYELRAELQA